MFLSLLFCMPSSFPPDYSAVARWQHRNQQWTAERKQSKNQQEDGRWIVYFIPILQTQCMYLGENMTKFPSKNSTATHRKKSNERVAPLISFVFSKSTRRCKFRLNSWINRWMDRIGLLLGLGMCWERACALISRLIMQASNGHCIGTWVGPRARWCSSVTTYSCLSLKPELLATRPQALFLCPLLYLSILACMLADTHSLQAHDAETYVDMHGHWCVQLQTNCMCCIRVCVCVCVR